MNETSEILFERRGQLAVVTLNRPQALNALTHGMCLSLKAKLDEWAEDDTVAAVLIKGAGEKAFCAGGDIRKLYDEGRAGGDYPCRFYGDEYRLNAAVKHFEKPYIAFMDGIVMGGGVGLSVHGTHRVVTERTLFAMPETGIGLFPDVGGSYFLPRCPGEIGMYLGLTGARMKAADCLHSVVADAYVPSMKLFGLENALAQADLSSGAHELVGDIIAEYAEHIGDGPIALDQPRIDRLFAGGSVEEILAALDADGSDWAAKTAAGLRAKSPTSMKITFRQIREGMHLDFDDCMRLEWRLVNRIVKGHDFYEGTRAVIVDKDQNPQWRPGRLEDVKDEDIDAYFAPLEGDELALG